MDLGQGYDDNNRLRRSSLSQHLMQQVLLPYLFLVISSCMNPHVCLMDNSQTHINSVDTFLYLYALPLESIPLNFSNLCLRLQPELQLKVVTFGKASTSSPCKRGAVGQTYERNETALSVERTKHVQHIATKNAKRVQDKQTIQKNYQRRQDP